MKLKMKLMAAAIALVAASGANAAITTSSSGNGELFFTIYDQGADLSSAADDRAYVRDLGSLLNGGTMNDWTNNSAITSPSPTLSANKQALGTIYSIAADANLQSFLAASTDTSRLQWNVAAVDTSGSDRLLTTAGSISAAQLPNYNVFRTFGAAGADIYLAAMNPALTGESALYSGAAAGVSKWGNNIGGKTLFSNAASLGDSMGFYLLSEKVASGSTTTIATLQQYMASPTVQMDWTLSDQGVLTVAAIPEPSEYALMLAGLGMLGFMARRRLNNRA